MRGVSTSCAVLALSLLPNAGCGPGRLPDLGFGTAGEAAATSDPSGAATSDSGDGDATTIADESGDELPGDGDGESTTTTGEPTTSTTGEPTTTTTGDGDGDTSADWTDSNDSADTWGDPPDVTNEPCDPLAQDCFPTHKCVPFATQPGSNFLDADKCMPILGDKQWGESCTLSSFNEAQDDCDGDGFCWNLEWVGGELHGTCVPFCVGSPQNLTCPIGWGCLFTGAVSLCAKQCDPFLQDCPDAYGCYWAGNNFQCLLTATPLGAGHSCDKVAECLPGLACVDKALVPGCVGPDDHCCTPWCNIDSPACAAPLECVPFFDPDEVPPLLADIGVCIQ